MQHPNPSHSGPTNEIKVLSGKEPNELVLQDLLLLLVIIIIPSEKANKYFRNITKMGVEVDGCKPLNEILIQRLPLSSESLEENGSVPSAME
jgi:hypothetical protein